MGHILNKTHISRKKGLLKTFFLEGIFRAFFIVFFPRLSELFFLGKLAKTNGTYSTNLTPRPLRKIFFGIQNTVKYYTLKSRAFYFWKSFRKSFWQKFRFLTEISIFAKKFDFWQKVRFFTKSSIFYKKFDLRQIFSGQISDPLFAS